MLIKRIPPDTVLISGRMNFDKMLFTIRKNGIRHFYKVRPKWIETITTLDNDGDELQTYLIGNVPINTGSLSFRRNRIKIFIAYDENNEEVGAVIRNGTERSWLMKFNKKDDYEKII